MKAKWKTRLKSLVCMMLAVLMILPTMVYAETTQQPAGTAEAQTKKITVNLSETDWKNVKIHYWGGTGATTWPGQAMNSVEGKTKEYTYDVPKDSTGIIFNTDGSGTMKQTVDVTDIREDVTYYVQPAATGKAAVIMKDKDGKIVEPEAPKADTMKVSFDNSATKWDKVSIHYWGSGVTGTTWPGAAMTLTDKEKNIYEAEVPVGITGIVFTCPDGKGDVTAKSSDVTDIPGKEEWKADKNISPEYISTGYEYEKYVVLRKDKDGKTYEPPVNPTAEQKKAKQINTHVGSDYSYVILSYTTIGKTDGKITLTDATGEVKTYTSKGVYSPSAEKYKYSKKLYGLKPATDYTYTIGEGDYAVSGTFKSIPAAGGNETLKFAYLTDPQISNAANAEAANATFHYVNQIKDLGFVYIGGDITDNSDAKLQWENLYASENGEFKTGGAECLSNNLIAVCQGNHDKNNDGTSLSGYITTPDDGGNLVYSIDYGKAKLIVLNLETAKSDETERKNQKAYLEKEVAEAKAKGQWTIVGFHKSLYTGASHIIDDDVVAARKFWSPVFAQLGVDVVLQAHDHVFARGFVNGDGTKGNLKKDASGAYISNKKTPLYYVGGHAGGLKWYSAKDYTVGEGDPLLSGYEFLDVNSAKAANPTDQTHETMYTIVEVSKDQFKTTTYAFKYDQDAHKVTTEPYVYDSLVIKKAENSQVTTSLPKKGSVVKDSKSGASYKVTKSDKKTGTVQFVKVTDKKVKTITVPSTIKVNGITFKVTSVDANAFTGCKNLKSIVIGTNVASVSSNTFSKCSSLRTLAIKSTKLTSKNISKTAFKGISTKATIKVPKSKLAAYKKLFVTKGLSKKVTIKAA